MLAEIDLRDVRAGQTLDLTEVAGMDLKLKVFAAEGGRVYLTPLGEGWEMFTNLEDPTELYLSFIGVPIGNEEEWE